MASQPAVTATPGTDTLHDETERECMFSQEFSLYVIVQWPFYSSNSSAFLSEVCRHLQLCLKQLGFTQAAFVLSFVLSLKVGSGLAKYIQYIKRWQLFQSSSFQITFLQHRINSFSYLWHSILFWRHRNDCFLNQEWFYLTESEAPCRTACTWGRGQELQYALLWFPVYCILLPAWCSSYLWCTRTHHFIKGILKMLLCLPPLQNTPKLHQKPESKQNLLSEQWNVHQEKKNRCECWVLETLLNNREKWGHAQQRLKN